MGLHNISQKQILSILDKNPAVGLLDSMIALTLVCWHPEVSRREGESNFFPILKWGIHPANAMKVAMVSFSNLKSH